MSSTKIVFDVQAALSKHMFALQWAARRMTSQDLGSEDKCQKEELAKWEAEICVDVYPRG